jgi:predicted PurR-regulated permease PerM
VEYTEAAAPSAGALRKNDASWPARGWCARRIAPIALIGLLALVFAGMVAPFLEALFLAVVFSALLRPLYMSIRAVVRRDAIAALVTTLLVLVLIVVPLVFLVGALTGEAIRITEFVAPWIDDSNGEDLPPTLPTWLPFAEQLQPYRGAILERVGNVANQASTFLVESFSRITQGTFVFLLNLFVMLYAIFYFLLRGPQLVVAVSRRFPIMSRAARDRICERGLAVTRATLKSILILGSLQGLLAGIGYAAAGLEGAILWGFMTAVASLIPGIGTAIVWVPAVAILLFSGDTVAGIGLGAWCVVAVGGIDNLVRPYLIGSDTQMSELLVLISTLGGLAMFGAAGIIIGPVIAGLLITSLNVFATAIRADVRPIFQTLDRE